LIIYPNDRRVQLVTNNTSTYSLHRNTKHAMEAKLYGFSHLNMQQTTQKLTTLCI